MLVGRDLARARCRRHVVNLPDVVGKEREAQAFTAFERLSQQFGLPERIRSNDGVPFSSPHCTA